MKAGPAKLIPRPWGTSLRATQPNEILSMDYMHIFPRHEEIKSFLLIIRCNFSTFCELTPSHYGTTTDAARALCNWFGRYGYNTKFLMSDRGSEFISHVMRKVAEATRTKQHFHQPYCKWSNGTVERAVRSAREAFRLPLSYFAAAPSTHWTPRGIVTAPLLLPATKSSPSAVRQMLHSSRPKRPR